MKYSKRLILITIVFLMNYCVDRLTKVFAVNYLHGQDQINILGDFIVLRYVRNNGAFLSLGSNWEHTFKLVVFIVIPLLACIFGLIYCMVKDLGKLSTILIISIVAGGIGNIQDRIFNNGFVIDFLNFGIGNIRTGVLNVADISITFGAILLALYEISKSIKENKSEPSSNIE